MYEKNRSDLMGIVFRRYPEFILSNRVSSIENIPVFTFHQLNRETFEPIIRHLAENDYIPIDADELYKYNASDNFIYGKEVVLTFDDGHESLYDVGYPLLKKYGFKGVAFIIPGLIDTYDENTAWGVNGNRLCHWREVREMHESGVIDFQLHSLYHHTIYTSSRIIEYVTPNSRLSFLKEALFPILDDGDGIQFPTSLPLGTPIYESAYRYGEKLKYFDSVALRKACQEFVLNSGGEAFFRSNRWKGQLQAFVIKNFEKLSKDARFESQEERRAAIRKDLKEAKAIIERNLNAKRINHLCFPWFSAAESTVSISSEEGFVTNFWGGFIPKFAQRWERPLQINRYNSMYIWRLPGKGRKTIREVFQNKLSGMVY
jgi:hypothetical protein